MLLREQVCGVADLVSRAKGEGCWREHRLVNMLGIESVNMRVGLKGQVLIWLDGS